MAILKSRGAKIALILLTIPLCLCILSLSVLVFAYYSNNNIPVASDIVEKLENILITEDQLKEMLSDQIKQQITDPIEIPKTGYQGFRANISTNITGESQGVETTFKSNGNIVGMYDGSKVSFTSDLDLETSGIEMNSNLELRSFTSKNENELYVKVNKIPAMLTAFIPTLAEINNKWIYSKNDLTELNKENENSANSQEYREVMLTLADMDEFLSLFKRSPDRVFNNVRTSCATVNVTDIKYNAILNKYAETSGKEVSSDLRIVNRFQLNVELCVGRRDFELYYVNVDFKSPEATVSLLIDGIEYSFDTLELEKPEGALNAEDLNLEELIVQ